MTITMSEYLKNAAELREMVAQLFVADGPGQVPHKQLVDDSRHHQVLQQIRQMLPASRLTTHDTRLSPDMGLLVAERRVAPKSTCFKRRFQPLQQIALLKVFCSVNGKETFSLLALRCVCGKKEWENGKNLY